MFRRSFSDDWLKVKCLRTHDFIVGGWIPDGARPFSTLLLGEFVDGELRLPLTFGLPNNEDDPTAAQTPNTLAFQRVISHAHARFYEPAIRVSVEFQDMTDDGHLRHAAFRRFAEDLTSELKPPKGDDRAEWR